MPKILVVDDEDIYCSHIERILSHAGHTVQTATGAAEAIRTAQSFAPDVLVVDWRLPGNCDGLRLAATLQQDRPQLRVIPITGYAVPELQQAANVRVFRVLEKPFGIQDLTDAVAAALAEPV